MKLWRITTKGRMKEIAARLTGVSASQEGPRERVDLCFDLTRPDGSEPTQAGSWRGIRVELSSVEAVDLIKQLEERVHWLSQNRKPSRIEVKDCGCCEAGCRCLTHSGSGPSVSCDRHRVFPDRLNQ